MNNLKYLFSTDKKENSLIEHWPLSVFLTIWMKGCHKCYWRGFKIASISEDHEQQLSWTETCFSKSHFCYKAVKIVKNFQDIKRGSYLSDIKSYEDSSKKLWKNNDKTDAI